MWPRHRPTEEEVASAEGTTTGQRQGSMQPARGQPRGRLHESRAMPLHRLARRVGGREREAYDTKGETQAEVQVDGG
jgi:hypothetical protein